MDIITYMSGVLSIAFANDKETLNKIEFVEEVCFENKENYITELAKASIDIEDNKKKALFGYIFLYYNLVDLADNFIEILKCCDLPIEVIKNYENIISLQAVERIKNDYKERNREFIEIFDEPNEYIIELITAAVRLPVQMPKKHLKNLNSHLYEHAEDRAALEKLSGNGALEKIIKLYSRYDIERLITIQYTGSNIKVTEKSIPYLYNALVEACNVLDIKDIPDLYLEQGFINAATYGSDRPIIVLSNACLSLLSYDELLFILGHELGHIKSQHVLYHTIGSYLPVIADYIGDFTLGIGNLVSSSVALLLENWNRKSELTADRAGLLVCQNIDSAISTMYKLAGFPPKFYDAMNIQDFIAQAETFCDFDKNYFDKAVKYLAAVGNTHPWTVMRAYELDRWFKSGGYDKIFEMCKRGTNESAAMINKCQRCGYENNSNANFCKKCGQKI